MFNIYGTRIDVQSVDPLKVAAEGLVIPANDHLWMGTGLGGAIKKVGGEDIEAEAVQQGPAELGQTLATVAGELPFARLYHAVIAGQDLKAQHEKIGPAVRAAIAAANRDGIKRLAFAPLESEELIGAFHDAARQVVSALLGELAGKTTLDMVILTTTKDECRDVYRQALLSGLGAGA